MHSDPQDSEQTLDITPNGFSSIKEPQVTPSGGAASYFCKSCNCYQAAKVNGAAGDHKYANGGGGVAEVEEKLTAVTLDSK